MICLKQTLMDWKEDRSLDVYLKYKKVFYWSLHTRKEKELKRRKKQNGNINFLY